jgi:hypothetical protein
MGSTVFIGLHRLSIYLNTMSMGNREFDEIHICLLGCTIFSQI